MSRYDNCHHQVVRALEKDGWQVEDVPLRLELPERTVYIDIEASRKTNGSRQQVMLAEVKCFPSSKATTTELYIAVGQYIIYRAILIEMRIPTPVYLAVPEDVYLTVFDSAVQRAFRDSRIKMVIVNLDEEVIKQWIE
jgi:hypothetical protein